MATLDRRPGRFVVLEGMDGSGTTTQVELLGKWLGQRGHTVCTTREPTDGPIGRLLRAALRGELVDKDNAPVSLDWAAMALLFAGDRVDHAAREIEPALSRGQHVISDRYDLSGLLYQSLTSPLGEAALPWLRAINERVLRPDLVIVLDLPHEVAAQRRAARGEPAELYERAELQRRLADAYGTADRLASSDRLVHVDAARSILEVHRQITEITEQFLV